MTTLYTTRLSVSPETGVVDHDGDVCVGVKHLNIVEEHTLTAEGEARKESAREYKTISRDEFALSFVFAAVAIMRIPSADIITMSFAGGAVVTIAIAVICALRASDLDIGTPYGASPVEVVPGGHVARVIAPFVDQNRYAIMVLHKTVVLPKFMKDEVARAMVEDAKEQSALKKARFEDRIEREADKVLGR